MRKKLKFYRDKIIEMRELAERTRDAALRKKLEKVASEYGRLADETERDAK